ncbi:MULTISPECIES: ATP-binding cassette domain-containing protein [Pectobacterium]|uniref:ATP-binding cassette domain-containing protein n=1 Tax=Pectobacterium TaxID=122277 RepID=UPI0018DAD4DD|nr:MULTISPECIES: ATP-binding cassette domain-containing protein [Pectobacterium]QPI42540.1 ATP-binding cassette domain-containing protein [Pectobacterium aroidearum]
MNYIQLNNIYTHNLKNINVTIYKNKITAIYGRSGAGKSSLVFSSLYQLCNDEFDALENGYSENSGYKIESYSGIIPAVAISQSIKNNNPRSTLYTYLNIAQILSFSAKEKKTLIPDFKYLKTNKPDNECPFCKGLGIIQKIDSISIIDQEKSVSGKPFSIWKTGTFSGLYHNLLLAYCEEENINTEIPFKNLPEPDKRKILFGKTQTRLDFKFKYKGVTRKRRAYYEGVLISAQNMIRKKSLEDATVREICNECLGSKVNISTYNRIQVMGINFVNFLTLPFSDLLINLGKLPTETELFRVIKSICDMGLGYLNFSRSVPSLSGGELQKIRFSRLLNSNISGVLLVIDEISSQINSADFPYIFEKIRKLSKNNTVVLVEHSLFFINNADFKIHIGPEAGQKGGYIYEDEEILPIARNKKKRQTDEFFFFPQINKNNVINQEVKIPKKCLTVLTGLSGSGKSSIARAIEEKVNAIYISQKSSSFSGRSVLASTIKVNTLIADYFSKNTGIDHEFFLLSKEAGCKTCAGSGVVKYERGYDKDFYLICPTCDGDLFDKDNEFIEIKVNGLSIVDFYKKEIKELYTFTSNIDTTINKTLETMISLGLGHLQLNRKTQTLSGGELRRVRLCEHLARKKETRKILIIDEPVSGLDPETASIIADFIYHKVSLFGAIILIEHRPEIINYSDYEIKVGPFSGNLGGKVLSQKFLD